MHRCDAIVSAGPPSRPHSQTAGYFSHRWNASELGKLFTKFRHGEVDEPPDLDRHYVSGKMDHVNRYRFDFKLLQNKIQLSCLDGCVDVVLEDKRCPNTINGGIDRSVGR